MASSLTSLEENLTCAICLDIYKEPLLLLCTHSFCRDCVERSWADLRVRECPVCRKRSLIDQPPINRALQSACESFLQERDQSSSVQSQGVMCTLHAERLQLFCEDEQKLVCVECVSQEHQMHKLCSIRKAASDRKNRLQATLQTLKKKEKKISSTKSTFQKICDTITSQAQQTDKQIKDEFEKLHRFLREEEEARIAALRKEEEEKSQRVKEKINVLDELQSTLSDNISKIHHYLMSDDAVFLQGFKDEAESTYFRETVPCPVLDSGSLIHVAKHIGNLKFRVWEKMKELCPYFPVILDPNTANNALSLSEDLTSVKRCPLQDLPKNLERFSTHPLVLGSEGFRSGRHCWEIEVGNSDAWVIGVAKQSVKRNEAIDNKAENGIWMITFHHGRYSFNREKPVLRYQRIRVQLDWSAGQVGFYNADTNERLHTCNATFREKIYPLLYVKHSSSLKIRPADVSVDYSGSHL